MKDESVRKVMAEFYSYLTKDGSEDKKADGTKSCVIKKPLNLKIKNIV